MENPSHEKCGCQEAFNELGHVNHCTDNLTDSNALDHQLPTLNNSIDFLIDTVSPTKAIKTKLLFKKLKTSTQRYLQTTAMTITKIIYVIQYFDHQLKLNNHQVT